MNASMIFCLAGVAWQVPCIFLQFRSGINSKSYWGYAAVCQWGIVFMELILFGGGWVFFSDWWKVFNLISAIVFTYIWWRIRRKGNKRPLLESLKSLLIKAKMVERMADNLWSGNSS